MVNFLSLAVYAQSVADDVANWKRKGRETRRYEDRGYDLVRKIRAVRHDLISFWEGIEPSSSFPSSFESGSSTFDQIRRHLTDYDITHIVRSYLTERSKKKDGKKELDRICEELKKVEEGQKSDRAYVLDFFDNLVDKGLSLSRTYDESEGSIFVPEGVRRLISKVA